MKMKMIGFAVVVLSLLLLSACNGRMQSGEDVDRARFIAERQMSH